jgi:hypothetical protein
MRGAMAGGFERWQGKRAKYLVRKTRSTRFILHSFMLDDLNMNNRTIPQHDPTGRRSIEQDEVP